MQDNAITLSQQFLDQLQPDSPVSRDQCIYHLVKAQAERNPHGIAIAAPGRVPLTYSRLHARMPAVVKILNGMGVGRNDRVAMVVPNGPEMASAFLSISSGATFAPLNPAYRASEFDFYLSHFKPKALVVQSGTDSPAIATAQKHSIPIIELSPVVEGDAGAFSLRGEKQLPASQGGFAQPQDVALILYTSGTTSRPKMVRLTHSNVLASAANTVAALQLTEQDRCLNVMPLFHIHGLIGAVLASLMVGGSVVCTSGFDAEKFFAWLGEFCPTWYTAVPTMHQAVLSCAQANAEVLASCSLRFIRSSSAALPPRVMQELEEVFHVPVVEAYGMTEAAHQIASNLLPPRERKAGSVGLAAGTEVSVMDEQGSLLSPEEIGEIVIRGPNVMSGYVNGSEANTESFTRAWFRTGDQGYLDADGYLFITGRLKEIINRGGEKISPREVDEVLMEHPAVSQAVTFAVPHVTLGEDVAGAVVLRDKVSVSGGEIQRFLAERLAEFKVPRQVLIVDEIPKSATGKLQRLELAEKLGLMASDRAASGMNVECTAPRTPVEEKLAKIWSQVLGIKQVGVHDNFFHLGGESIQATRVISRVRESMGVELSFLTFFRNSTVAQMARSIEAANREARGEEAPALQPIPRDGEIPLSYAQERMWFFDQLEPGNPAYNRPAFIRFTGPLSVATLEQCLNEIIRRHEVLRTTFAAVDGGPIQVISPPQPLTLSVRDISGLPEGERKDEVRRLATDEASLAFDLARGPLIRARLLRLGEEEHILLLMTRHIVFDGWSMEVLLQEISALYEAFSTGGSSPLPELPIQYADFAVWQRQWLQGEVLEAQLSYWKQQLGGGVPVLELPTDHLRPPVQTFRGARQSLMLTKALTDALKALSQRENVTLFMTLLGAFQVLLHRYTGQYDIAVGVPIAGRNQAETENLIGVFVNMSVLRTDLSGDPSFRELLGRVREVALGAYAHQELPFGKLVEELQPKRDLSRNPLVQVVFQLKNVPQKPVELLDLRMEPFKFDSGIVLFDLSVEIEEKAEGLVCLFEYNTDLFNEGTVNRMNRHFLTLLEAIAANPSRRISELPLLTEAERRQVLIEWNDTKREYPKYKCIHESFEEQVRRTPDAVAVVFESKQLTYRELNQRANQLAHHLESLGVGPGVLVGICLERSLEMVIGVLGILKAGGAYIPLDPDYPRERLAFMLEDARVPVLLTHRQLVHRLPEHKAKIVLLDADWEVMARESKKNPVPGVTAENLAYVIYTSGSTGKPKGVLVEHRGLCNLAEAQVHAFDIRPDDMVLQFANLSFDASVSEIFMALLAGATLCVATQDSLLPGSSLIRVLRDRAITTVTLPPSVLAALATGEFPALRTVIVAGEVCPDGILARWAIGHRVLNAYGPTESTVCATFATYEQGEKPAIGRPIANTQVYLLDSCLQPVPIGVPGQLHVAGLGLARGYLNQPELTAEKFIPHPFGTEPGARLYGTGDLACYLPDGNIKFLGRVDDQVKIRGFRIEPGEIEAVLTAHPAVEESIVAAREDVLGDKCLVAYVVPKQGQVPTINELRGFLNERLPAYMVPSVTVMLDALPLTPNGKVDRRALPRPDGMRPELETAFVSPRTPVEKRLAEIWREVLGLEQVGIHDHFFELGGHSLLATRLIARVREAFQIDLPLKILFIDAPTVAGLATAIELRQIGQADISEVATLLEELETLSDEEVRALLVSEG